MDITGAVWFITCAVILGLFVFDFFAHVRVPHEPTFKESAIWSSVYIGLAVAFGFVVWALWGAGGSTRVSTSPGMSPRRH